MRTLRIEKGGRVILDGSQVDLYKLENKSEFISGALNLDVEISDDINITDIIHFFYDAKDLIRSIFSEEYEVVRALVTSANLSRNYKYIRVYKSFKIEREVFDNQKFIYMIPEIELVPSEPGEDGVKALGALPIIIDENIEFIHEDLISDQSITIKSKTKISLFDLMLCLFDDLPELVKEGIVLSH